jgi:hypothetical protein
MLSLVFKVQTSPYGIIWHYINVFWKHSVCILFPFKGPFRLTTIDYFTGMGDGKGCEET